MTWDDFYDELDRIKGERASATRDLDEKREAEEDLIKKEYSQKSAEISLRYYPLRKAITDPFDERIKALRAKFETEQATANIATSPVS